MQITLKPKFRRNLVKRWVWLHFRDSQSLKLLKNRFLKKIFPMKSQSIKINTHFKRTDFIKPFFMQKFGESIYLFRSTFCVFSQCFPWKNRSMTSLNMSFGEMASNIVIEERTLWISIGPNISIAVLSSCFNNAVVISLSLLPRMGWLRYSIASFKSRIP